jgi:uncharacterized membrane protein
MKLSISVVGSDVLNWFGFIIIRATLLIVGFAFLIAGLLFGYNLQGVQLWEIFRALLCSLAGLALLGLFVILKKRE